jgi:tRNA 2-thiouridine synthesizing protein A
MTAPDILDLRGLSCPEPALLARQALQKASKGTVEVIVGSTTARENVSRTAQNLGWQVTSAIRSEDEIHLIMNK